MKKQVYAGIANASGALAIDHQHFIVADDEDNQLRIYARDISDNPLQIISLKNIFAGEISDGEKLEIDLEGAAAVDDAYFWIGSHSTSRKGSPRPARHRLFALHIKPDGSSLFSVSRCGSIYTHLIADLSQDSRFKNYAFAKAAAIPPKTIGGLSIEGLAATPDKGLLIGFRNPLVNSKAILIPLKNPFDVVAGKKPEFGDSIELDLNGYGIRDIVWRKKQQYLIVAGPYHGNDGSNNQKLQKNKLYLWSSKSGKLKALKKIDLKTFNIEAAFFYPDQDDFVQLLSDDGRQGRELGFRSLWLKI